MMKDNGAIGYRVAAATQNIKERDYWLNKLSGQPGITTFPCDRVEKTPAKQESPGVITFEFTGDLFDQFMKLSNRIDYSLHMILLAGVMVLLEKYSGNHDIIVGAPIYKQEMEGKFINTILAIRDKIEGNMTFKELLLLVRTTLLEATENQNYPIETLLYKLNIQLSEDTFPLFNVAVLLENVHDKRHIEHIHLNMIFSFRRTGESVEGVVEYNPQLYEKTTVTRIIDHFKNLMTTALFNLEMKVDELEILSPENKKQLLYDFNDTVVNHPTDKTIHGLFQDRVSRQPQAPALLFEGKQLAYGELDERSTQLSRLLKIKGIKTGNIVGLIVERSFEMIVGMLGILKAGAAYLPIDREYPEERVKYMFEDSGAQLLLFQKHLESRVKINTERIDLTDDTIYSPGTGKENKNERSGIVDPTNLAYVIYTSGSTGKAKGVAVEHHSIVNTLLWRKNYYNFSPQDVILQVLGYTFDSSVEDIFTTLVSGGTLALIQQDNVYDLHYLKKLIDETGVTYFLIVPGFYKSFLAEIPGSLKKVRAITVAGDNITENLVKRHFELLPGVRLYNEYGPTENSVCTTVYEFSPTQTRVLIGKPIDNVSCYILGPAGQVNPIGVPGELCVSGRGLTRGYLKRAELTHGKFVKNPFIPGERMYRTGDLAKWLPDGNIEFLGRIDYQVKIRGFRIELGEIESELLNREGIKEAVVAVWGDNAENTMERGEGDKYLCAYIVSETTIDPSSLKEQLGLKLPGYMIPPHFIQLEQIPLTPNGKINRKALPKPEIAKGTGKYAAPRNIIEQKMSRIWCEVLKTGNEQMGIDVNFFESGGHSLKATILVSKIQKEFNIKLPMAQVFEKPTIRELSAYVTEAAEHQFTSIRPAEEKDYYVLSSAQNRLYILQQLDQASTAYNIYEIHMLEGKVAIKNLEDIFRKLIHTHESLRTSFTLAGGKPVQQVHKPSETRLTIDYYAPGEENEENKEKKAREIVNNFRRPFNLSRAPLLQVGLVKLAPQEHILMVNIHHIVSDGVSHGILIESFLSMYRGLELPDLKIQYKDYAEWQQRPAVKEEMKSQEKYWLQEFRGEIPVLFLPTDFPRPEIQDFSGNFVSFDLDREKAAQLTEISQSQEVTLFMLLLALFNVFLLKLSNQEDIITGTPIAGRRHADLEGVVGMFVNTLAVRCFPAGQKTFLTFLKEVKEKVLTIFENQDYQFEDLVENVLLERDMSRNPLFDVSFTLDNVFETSASGEAPPAGNRDLKTSPYPYDVTISKFDLALTAKETPVAMIFHFGYSSKLFKEETILRFSRYLKWIISMVIENPNREISGLEILSAEEKKQLLVDFNDTAAYYPKDKTIQQLFREEVEKKPGAAAVVEVEPGRLPFIVTNRELNERATWMARLLRQKDITPGTIVGIMMGRSVEMIIALLGILEVGGAYLPLDPDYPGERLNYMLKDSSSNVLLTTGRLLAERKERKREEKPEHWQGEVILLDKMNWSAPPASQLSPRQQPITNPANFAYIIYTSGSTGRPRGVMVGHRNVVRLVKGTNYILFKQEDRLLLTGSIAFDITTFEIWAPLLNGIALYLADQNVIMEAEKFKKILDENQISVLHLIPQLFSQLAHQLPVIFERLRYFLVGGDLVKPYYVNKIRNLYPGVKILHMYGPTENTTFSTFMLVDRDYENTIPIGKPIGNSTGYIVDRYNKLAAVGVPGELLVGGDGVAAGYLNRPELTAEKFDYDFWDLSDYHDEQEPLGQDINVFGAGEVRQLRQLTQINKKFLRGSRGQFLQKVPPGRRRQKIYKTGDIVRWLPEGTIEFLGREDTQVKIKGIRIELGEIENQLLNHEEIKETVVIARANNSGEKFLCVYYTADREIPVSALREYLFGRLPDSMIPAYYIHMTKLPLTPNGKIDRKLLPLPGDTRPNLEITYAAPKSDLEQTFADIWQKSLNIDKVGLNDNFFELGGNSLSIVKVHSELKQRLENDIPLVALFRYPTIAALVAYINRGAKSIIRDDRIEESVNRMEETLQMLLGEENE